MKKRLSLHDKALLAMREAVREVIERHRKEKRPLAVWDRKAQKVKWISPQTALRQFNKQIRLEHQRSRKRV
jgi:mRNA-degrading endonuclease HigB of HigAB toxin-antitoxin module